ncbi:MAG: hypothetical protein ABSD42_01485 [Candidatus Bathyarchaeia archaeon]|jgi:hypothetical protein
MIPFEIFNPSAFSKKQKRHLMRIKSGFSVAVAQKERVSFLTLSTQYDKTQPHKRLKRIKDLNYAFTKLKQHIEYYIQRKMYLSFCHKNHLEPFEIHSRKKSIKYPEYWQMFRFKLKYFKLKTSEGGGVLHIVFRKGYNVPPIPKNWLHRQWFKIWGSWNTSISEVSINSSQGLSMYLVGQYFVKQPVLRMSYGQQWVYPGFVKGFRKVCEVYANMRQSPNIEPREHSPFKRAIEVWNKNIEKGCLPNPGHQKRFRWRRLPEKRQGVLGNLTVKTVDCCIDSPKYLHEYGIVWTIFTPIPKKKFDYSKIYAYYKKLEN